MEIRFQVKIALPGIVTCKSSIIVIKINQLFTGQLLGCLLKSCVDRGIITIARKVFKFGLLFEKRKQAHFSINYCKYDNKF